MLKLAMIGCGGIGAYHLGHFLLSGDLAEPVGFCDLIPERAEAFREKAADLAPNAGTYTDYRTMLDEAKPDAVFVCVPPYSHGEIEFELIRRGIPFFVEKPVALDLRLAAEIRDAAEERRLITAAGYQVRYSNLTPVLADFCRENTVVCVNASRIEGVPPMFWWKDKDLSGGQIVEQTTHQLDMLRYVFGEPVEVFTCAAHGFVTGITDYNTDDASVTVIRFANGAIGTLMTGCYALTGDAYASKVVFSARDCRAEWKLLDSLEVFGVKSEEGKRSKRTSAPVTVPAEVSEDGSRLLYRQDGDAGLLCDRTFLEACITGDGSRIRSNYADAVKTLTFTMACNESMRTGMPVKL